MLLVLAGATLAGCAARARSGPLPRDTLWYVSTRARDDRGRDRRARADSLEYGAVIFERTPVPDPFADPLTLTRRDSLRLSREAFLQAVRTRVEAQPAPDDYVLLYVHGFGTGLDECWTHPLHARTRAQSTAPWVAFCWPSHGAGITWPRVGSVFVRAYEDDTTAVTASAGAFRQVLRELTDAVGAERTLVVSHSLGGRLVSEALARPDTSGAAPPRDPLRGVAFLALDHDAARFGDTLVPALQPRAQRLVLYATRRDRALTIARRMHDTPRAGLAEPAPLVRPGLETVDVTDAFAADGWWQRLFGNRHSLRRASAVLWDLTHVVGRGAEASCRDTVASGDRRADGSWQLRATRPDTTRLTRCVGRATSSPAGS
jgi:esterase/lipase superfamily enzyme